MLQVQSALLSFSAVPNVVRAFQNETKVEIPETFANCQSAQVLCLQWPSSQELQHKLLAEQAPQTNPLEHWLLTNNVFVGDSRMQTLVRHPPVSSGACHNQCRFSAFSFGGLELHIVSCKHDPLEHAVNVKPEP